MRDARLRRFFSEKLKNYACPPRAHAYRASAAFDSGDTSMENNATCVQACAAVKKT